MQHAQVWQGKLKLGSEDGCSASMQGLTGAPGSLALIAHHVSPFSDALLVTLSIMLRSNQGANLLSSVANQVCKPCQARSQPSAAAV